VASDEVAESGGRRPLRAENPQPIRNPADVAASAAVQHDRLMTSKAGPASDANGSGAARPSTESASRQGPLGGLTPFDQARVVFAAFDAKDVATLASLVSDDVRIRLGNAEEAQGKPAFVAAVKAFLASVAAFHHHVVNVWHDGGALIAQLEVQYTRHDGAEVTLPCCNVFQLSDGSLADYRVYMDISPVYE
jgi:ketosteroid isomerase-like protein